jgi:hypothetical protein
LEIPDTHPFHCLPPPSPPRVHQRFYLLLGLSHLTFFSPLIFFGALGLQKKKKSLLSPALSQFAPPVGERRKQLKEPRGSGPARTVPRGRPRPPHPDSVSACAGQPRPREKTELTALSFTSFAQRFLESVPQKKIEVCGGECGGSPEPWSSKGMQGRVWEQPQETEAGGRWALGREYWGWVPERLCAPTTAGPRVAPAQVLQQALALRHPRVRHLRLESGHPSNCLSCALVKVSKEYLLRLCSWCKGGKRWGKEVGGGGSVVV